MKIGILVQIIVLYIQRFFGMTMTTDDDRQTFAFVDVIYFKHKGI